MEKDKEWLKEEINKVTSRIYGADFNTIKETDDLINQLEEPQQEKVVVPQFAADWYEEHKKTLDYGIYWLCIGNQQFIDGKSSELTEIGKWFHETKGAILILCSMKNGYEVEKEKLYRVKLLPINRGYLAQWDGTSLQIEDADTGERYENCKTIFTEQEIKTFDERFWTFAEEITK